MDGKSLNNGSLLAVIAICALLAGCKSEPATRPTAVAAISSTATQLGQAPEPDTQVNTPRSVLESQPAETPSPTATLTTTPLPSATASHSATATQPAPTLTPFSSATPSDIATSTQPPPPAPKIICTDASKLFFEDPPQECGAEPPIYSYAAAQRFEHGLMIWIEAADVFFVFADDRQFWRFFSGPLQLKPGASVDNGVGGAPSGYYEPVSGFGLIWRGEVERAEAVRDNLGWAVQPEFGFETVYQRGIESNWSFHRYVRDPDGRVIYVSSVAYAYSRWDYVDQ